MSDSKAKRWVITATLLFATSATADPLTELIQQGDSYVGEQRRTAESQPTPEQESRPKPKPTIADSLAKIASLLGAPESNEAAERGQRDLEAQEGMAKYAHWMAVAAIAQAFLTFVGIILVWRTLVATRNATSAAAKAAKAAEDAVTVTREIGEKQVRAYIGIFNSTIANIAVDAVPKFNITIKNTGQSPAIGLNIIYRADIGPTASFEKIFFPNRHDRGSQMDIPSGGVHSIPITFPIPMSAEHISFLKNGKLIFNVVGIIQYRDIFGSLRRVVFKMQSDSEIAIAGGGSFNAYHKNNRSN